jgi:hypothetical protein
MMRALKIGALLSLVALMTGCAAVTQQDLAETEKLCDLRGRTEVAVLLGKMPLSNAERNNMSLAMMALNQYPTENEKQAILKLDELSKPCETKAEQNSDKIGAMMPEISGVARNSRAALKANQAALYAGQITYGEYNKNVQFIVSRYMDTATQIVGAYQRRQQANAQALSQIYLQELMKQPTFTSCNAFGNTLNCSTR